MMPNPEEIKWWAMEEAELDRAEDEQLLIPVKGKNMSTSLAARVREQLSVLSNTKSNEEFDNAIIQVLILLPEVLEVLDGLGTKNERAAPPRRVE